MNQVQLALAAIPPEWEQVKTGNIKIGDKLWHLDKGFFDATSGQTSLISRAVKDRYCVIRKIKKAPITAPLKDSEVHINKLTKIATKQS